VSEDEAKAQSETFEAELINNGKARHEEANFEMLGQGWAHWTADEGLPVMEDLLVANPDINIVLGENDNMMIGAMEALKSVNKLDQVQIFAAADGQKEALALISEGSSFKATGENSPAKVAALTFKIAEEILVDGADPESYPEYSFTEAAAITPENIDQYYDPDSLF
jgi:ribose transport system substrate-binding protein